MIIETGANVDAIAGETTGGGIPAAIVRNKVTLRFPGAPQADAALQALGQPTQGTADVEIDDAAAVRQIVSTMRAGPTNVQITWTVSGTNFIASVISGPGGNFLSNEISFRVLRLLANTPGASGVRSFHVHTQRGTAQLGGVIPPAAGTARTQAIAVANRVRTTLITTLQRIVASVAARIAGLRP
jgi:hypothetical protein